MPNPRSLLSSAKLIAVCTLASRVTGLVRDVLLAHAFGQGRVADAFAFGFQIPNIFRRLFGEGALNAAFVPTFTQTLENEGQPAAWALVARTATLLSIVLVALLGAVELILLVLWTLWGDEDNGLVLALTAIMAPFMVSVCLLALFSGILNCLGSFVPGALASIVLNVAMIAGITLLAPWIGGKDPARQIYGVALSVLAAGMLQLLFVWPALRRHGFALRWNFDPHDGAVRRLIALMGPVLLGQGALMISTYLDAQTCILLMRTDKTPADATVFGAGIPYPLDQGALAALNNAQRLYQFPLGVLVISLATAALPAFARLAARGDWGPWESQMRAMLRLAIFEGILAGAMMIAAAEPIVRLLFEYGRFDSSATTRAARILSCYGFGMWAFCAMHIVSRGYYSLSDVRTPLRISLVLLPANFLLSLALLWVDPIREAAFAISSVLTASGSVLFGLYGLRKSGRERIVDAATGAALISMLVCGGIACVAVVVARRELLPALLAMTNVEFVRRAIDALGSLTLGMIVYVGAAVLFRLPEPAMLALRVHRGSSSAVQSTSDG